MLCCYINVFATCQFNNKKFFRKNIKNKGYERTEKKATLFAMDSIFPKAAQVVAITETGMYFTKTMAILINKKDPSKNDTVYSKDRPFLVKADAKRGYDNIIYEYTIEETKKEPSSASITRKEYNQ